VNSQLLFIYLQKNIVLHLSPQSQVHQQQYIDAPKPVSVPFGVRFESVWSVRFVTESRSYWIEFTAVG